MKTFARSMIALAIVIVTALGACARSRGSRSPAPEAGTATPVIAKDAGQDAIVEEAAATTASPEEGKIVCGSAHCRAKEQICCEQWTYGERESRCVSASPMDDFEKAEPYRICGRYSQEGVETRGVACDESRSCGENRVCCHVFGGSHSDQVMCTPLDAAKIFPCPGYEACVPSVPCRTRGAVCEEGQCVVPRPDHPIVCGATACAKDRPVCCQKSDPASGKHKLGCTTESDCPSSEVRFRCTRPSDCARGEFCGLTAMGTFCTHSLDGATSPLCRTVADCPRAFTDFCKEAKLPVRCRVDASDGLAMGLCGC